MPMTTAVTLPLEALELDPLADGRDLAVDCVLDRARVLAFPWTTKPRIVVNTSRIGKIEKKA